MPGSVFIALLLPQFKDINSIADVGWGSNGKERDILSCGNRKRARGSEMTLLIIPQSFLSFTWTFFLYCLCIISHSLLSFKAGWLTVCSHFLLELHRWWKHTHAHTLRNTHSRGRKSLWEQDVDLVFISAFSENPWRSTEEQPTDVKPEIQATKQKYRLMYIQLLSHQTIYNKRTKSTYLFTAIVWRDNIYKNSSGSQTQRNWVKGKPRDWFYIYWCIIKCLIFV